MLYYSKATNSLNFHFRLFTFHICIYSLLKLSTGFAIAAFIAWKLIVITAISIAIIPAIKKSHQLI